MWRVASYTIAPAGTCARSNFSAMALAAWLSGQVVVLSVGSPLRLIASSPSTVSSGEIHRFPFATTTLTGSDDAIAPAVLRASAVTTYPPSDTDAVSHSSAYGTERSSLPRVAPSSMNWTLAMPVASDALAVKRVVPDSVCFESGLTSDTLGATLASAGGVSPVVPILSGPIESAVIIAGIGAPDDATEYVTSRFGLRVGSAFSMLAK